MYILSVSFGACACAFLSSISFYEVICSRVQAQRFIFRIIFAGLVAAVAVCVCIAYSSQALGSIQHTAYSTERSANDERPFSLK